MGTAGFLLQLLGLFACTGAAIAYVAAFTGKSNSYLKIGNILFLISSSAIVLASVILLTALITSDFSIMYVAQYTDLSLPLLYKISAFWGGQSGSLLLWALLIVVFGAIEIVRIRTQSVEYRSAVYLATSVTGVFFILLICFVQNPFSVLDFMPRDGQGLNPMLQNPGMIIHPPTLYIGYVGFTIVIAHAVAALMTKNMTNLWIVLSRGWTMIIWVFLTIGIVIGGWWAYVELGWGGYWAWDPVENASLFPWLTATAFIHSAYVYEKRNTMKAWCFALMLITFELTILGTFITRSGVIQSVHSFGKNPIGNFFLWFIFLSTVAFLILMFKNRKVMEDKGDFKFLTREGVLFIGNWLFAGITFVIVLGTFLPWVTELMGVQPITVDLSYFNKVSTPFFIAIILLSGVGPLIPFGDISTGKFFRKLIIPFVIALAGTAVFYFLGYTLLVSLMLTFCIIFAFVSVVMKIGGRIKSSGVKSLISQNRFYAGMLVHFSLVVMAFGVTMSAFYNYNTDEIVPQNSFMTLGKYDLEIGEVTTEKGANYISHFVPIKIFEKGTNKYISTGYPEMRLYNNHQDNSFAEVSYYSMLKGDLYFIFSGFDLDLNQVRINAIFQPFIGWIWAGCILMSIGGFYSAFNFARRKEEKKAAVK